MPFEAWNWVKLPRVVWHYSLSREGIGPSPGSLQILKSGKEGVRGKAEWGQGTFNVTIARKERILAIQKRLG